MQHSLLNIYINHRGLGFQDADICGITVCHWHFLQPYTNLHKLPELYERWQTHLAKTVFDVAVAAVSCVAIAHDS